MDGMEFVPVCWATCALRELPPTRPCRPVQRQFLTLLDGVSSRVAMIYTMPGLSWETPSTVKRSGPMMELTRMFGDGCGALCGAIVRKEPAIAADPEALLPSEL